jgi:hypothetical protein
MAGTILMMLASQATIARDNHHNDVMLADFQAAMLNHIDMVGSPQLQKQFAELTYEDWELIYEWVPDKNEFIDATQSMRVLADSAGRINPLRGESVKSPNGMFIGSKALLPAQSFVPAYPSGGNYNTYTATLPGLGLLVDSSDIGTETGTAVNNERCDTNGEAGAWIAHAVLVIAADVGNTACSATPSPFEPATCIPAGALNAAVSASEIVLNQCAFQTGLVDSAEIEAGYENSVEVMGTVNNIDVMINDETNFTDDVELNAHDTGIKAVMSIHDTDIKSAVSTHDTDIKSAVSAHDTDIKSAVSTHDTDIKAALSTHDADIKALLANVQAGVDQNGVKLDLLLARQLEVIRLLHTPEGRRSTDIPACNGGPCSWNR